MSATGLLALNFCVLLLLVTAEGPIQLLPNSLESEKQAYVQKPEKYTNKYITRISEVPHHVLIAYQNLYCSGSLIVNRIVVTAASCFITMSSNTTVIVKVGSLTMTDNGLSSQVIEVLEVKKHEYFGLITDLDNDIALLMLKDHVKFTTTVKQIPLIEEQDMTQDLKIFKVCGWGSMVYGPSHVPAKFTAVPVVTSGETQLKVLLTRSVRFSKNYAFNLSPQYANRLLCSDMKFVNNSQCWDLYKALLTKSNYCLEYENKFRLSDNGGSAVYDGHLTGVVSYGADRQTRPFIALITNITFFKRWINVNVKRFLEKYSVPKPEYEYFYTSSESETSLSVEI